MHTNTSITLFCRNEKYIVNKAFVDYNSISTMVRSGASVKRDGIVIIPKNEFPVGLDKIRTNDIVIVGNCQETIDSTSDETIATSVKALKVAHQLYTVKEIDPKLYGSEMMQHYKLSIVG